MQGVSRRPFPDLPSISAFPELNVRTYVERDGRPGVWFFSLDATLALAVWAGRRIFHLPYHRARIAIEPVGRDRFAYRCARADGRALFDGVYGPTGSAHEAQPGTLEHFSSERYCLYAQRPDGALVRADVHHAPWPLQPAELTLHSNTMGAASGIELHGPPALTHFARRVDVVVWSTVVLDAVTRSPPAP
jgi:uncharacterized protein